MRPGDIAPTFIPLTRIWPSVGRSARNRSFSNVVLPAPDGPVRNTNSPRDSWNVTSRRTRLPRNSFWTWYSSIKSALLQELLEKAVCDRRMRLLLRGFHHLADEPTEGLRLPRPEGHDLLRVRRDHRLDD